MNEWFIFNNGVVVGPYQEETITKFLHKNTLNGDSVVRKGRTGEWQRICQTPEFADILSSGSPEKEIRQAIFISLENEKIAKVACPECGQHYRVSRDLTLQDRLSCVKCKTEFRFCMPQDTQPAENISWNKEADFSDDIPDGPIICPHCWKSFSEESLLYIAKHSSLTGDPIVGEFEQKRFAPTAFNQLGQPLDNCGIPCTDMACPKCHLKMPSPLIDLRSRYFSIVGAPSSGKSYYLTTLVHILRRKMSNLFGCSFIDADPQMNEVLNRYESLIFMTVDQDSVAVLPKTHQTGSDFTDSVLLNNVQMDLPKPFIFEMRTMDDDQDKNCNLIFYDNAGEQFQPGAETFVNPATQHLACSDGIIFMFDPLNDPKMRQICKTDDPQIESSTKISDQLFLFAEMIARIRRHKNMTAEEKCSIPLVIVMAKCDAWKSALRIQPETVQTVEEDPETMETKLNLNGILNVSFALREMLLEYAPGILDSAESFFEHVYFVPESNFGVPAKRGSGGFIGVIPKEITPVWAEVPFLILMHELNMIKAMPDDSITFDKVLNQVHTDRHCIFFKHPVTGRKTRLPLNYLGKTIDIQGVRYKIPNSNAAHQKHTDIWK